MRGRRIGSLIGVGLVLSVACARGSVAGSKCSSENIEKMRLALAEGSAKPACEDVEAALKLLPVTEVATAAGWEYSGERELRLELRTKYNITVSGGMMPLGYAERANGSILVFAYDVSGVLGRRWPLMSLVAEFQSHAPESGKELEYILLAVGERSQFTQVALYPKAAGKGQRKESNWIRFTDSMSPWGAEKPPRTKNCLPCKGWLCSSDAVVCLGDFDRSGFEQLAFRSCNAEFCGVSTVWADQKGGLTYTLRTTQPGSWEQRSGNDLYVGSPTCESSLSFCGFPSGCVPGKVYLKNKKTRIYLENAKWTSQVYPIEIREAPISCHVEHAEGILVMAQGRKFIRFVSK